MPRRVGRSPLALLGGLIVLYLALPLVAFAVRFLTTPERGFHEAGLFPALWVSVSCATISLALITLFGVPLAYLLARSTSRVAYVVGLIVQIPLALPPLMSGIVLIYIIGPYTFLGQLFGERLTNSKIGVVIAMTFVAAPFLIVAARAAFASVDQGLLDVAGTLGHSDVSRFLRVAVPVAGGGIRAGMLLAWLRAFGEYGAVVVLAYNPMSLPIYTYNQFSGVGLRTTLAPTALAIAVAIVVVVVSRLRRPRSRRHALVLGDGVAPRRTPTRPLRFDLDYHLTTFHLTLHDESDASHLAVLGPSGSGKSVLLRSLAGLYGAAPGDVWCGDENLQKRSPVDRRVGYVAQGFSLFPHLTVEQQLLFPRGATRELAAYWLGQLRLESLATRYPSEMSGGQRQRVALAQVLCSSPRVLLLDEPFSALDVPVRLELRRELRRLQRDTGLATVLVTHDPEEAAFLAERIVVIDDGHALQSGTSRQLFRQPATTEVARLLGISNMHHGVVVADGVVESSGVRISTSPVNLPLGTRIAWTIRPDDVLVTALAKTSVHGDDELSGTISDVADLGTVSELFVTLAPEFELRVRTTDEVDFVVGDACHVLLRPERLSLWASDVDGPLGVTPRAGSSS